MKLNLRKSKKLKRDRHEKKKKKMTNNTFPEKT